MVEQIAALCLSLAIDEGIVHYIYEDHLGNRTVGVGHLITDSDPESELPTGTFVSRERIVELFAQDCVRTHTGVFSLFPELYKHPTDVQNILTEMVFQMGVTGVSQFKNMRKALEKSDYQKASVEMLDSRWAKQTPNRAKRLADRMKSHVSA